MATKHQTLSIPYFYLYGEAQQTVAEGFVHVESLDDRSRPSEWTIQTHIHRDLNHIILIAEGGGEMQAEAATVRFQAPCLLLVPAGVPHGFGWHQESRGHVVTIADSYVRRLVERNPDLATLLHRAIGVRLSRADCRTAQALIGQMERELNWSKPGQRAAVEASLLQTMVLSLRSAHLDTTPSAGRSRDAVIVARLRERIEQRFRLRESVDTQARDLGVSPTTLRLACARVAGLSPASMLDARAMLEAQRLLLYSSMSISEIAYAIGFEDPAYFSRFFSRHAGHSPTAYRLKRDINA